MRRDRRDGLHTGGFIYGYEGSPLGGYDMALARTGKLLAKYNIDFQPVTTEDLPAPTVMETPIYDRIRNITGGGTAEIGDCNEQRVDGREEAE